MAFVEIKVHIPPDLWTLPDVGKRIIEHWHRHAQELGQAETATVAARTPVLTGALRSSVVGEYPGAGDTLLRIYFDDGPQLATWKRVYDKYQEGPPLGVSTYTNPPRHMLQSADPNDLPLIKSWAAVYAQEAIDAFTGAAVVVP
jgi:hypothetical protein